MAKMFNENVLPYYRLSAQHVVEGSSQLSLEELMKGESTTKVARAEVIVNKYQVLTQEYQN